MRQRKVLTGLATALVAALVPACQAPARTDAAPVPPEAHHLAHETAPSATAIFAGGCFWGMEAVFSHVRGVTSVVSGYEGGARSTAFYERVSTGNTGHAESVRVTYDPHVIRYDELLRLFFGVASDPTQLDRQKPDVGTQYRNALVPLNPEQAAVARDYLAQLKAADPWHRPIVTAIEPAKGFFPAEDYHQDFALKHPDHPYIRAWDHPRIVALQHMFPQYWKSSFTPN